MNEIEKIEGKIKEIYGKKETFCKEQNYKYKSFASKMRTIINYIHNVNEFLSPLKLQVEITAKREKPTHKIVQFDSKKFEGTLSECIEIKKQLVEQFGSHDLDIVPIKFPTNKF